MTQILDTYGPESFTDAQGKLEWEQAMRHEMDSLEKNHTWDLVSQPPGKNLIKCQWVYLTKFTSNYAIEHHKGRLVAKGFSQQEGIDYTKTFAPVAKMNSIRLILSLSTRFKWKIHQMYVKSAFLHGDLYEEIYMEKPLSFMTDSNLVC